MAEEKNTPVETKAAEQPAYVTRMVGEYRQTKERFVKLTKMLNRWEAFHRCYDRHPEVNEGDAFIEWMGFKPSCSYELLKQQHDAMANYLHVLEVRAEIEGVNLNE